MADPQHPDIAALVERANARLLVMSRVESPTYGQAANGEIIEELRDALRTLARPVEDEEARDRCAALERIAAWADPRACNFAHQLREIASLLARLAREKASAEQERDHLHRAHVLAAEDAARRLKQATRAEQEAARLRNSATMVLEAIGALSTLRNGKTLFEGSPIRDPFCAAAWVQLNNAVDECERALAAAAGAEEPR